MRYIEEARLKQKNQQLELEVAKLRDALHWHSVRWEALQKWQTTIPRQLAIECCDILANGKVAPWRKRRQDDHKI